MIKNLVLDIGNVIGEWNPTRLSASVFDSKDDQESLLDATVRHSDWLDLDRGVLSLEQAIANAQARTTLDKAKVAQLYHNLPASLTPIQSTLSAMQRAADAGVPMYILSNMQTHAWDYLYKTHACFALCTGVVVSCDTGLIKPDPKIYAYLTDQFSLKPNECIFVDDMPENITAARACGWEAEQLKDPNKGGELIDQLISRIVS